jgi:gliding motility-associated-like protein
VYLVGNGTGGTFTDCDIIGNVAGAGGAKGTGQPATAFGLGATGSTFGGSCSPQGKGGNGGNGGAGGAGGDGQPGAPGVTAEIVSNGTAPTYTTHGTATAITTGINNPAIFNLGAQTVITAANISCTNRNDTLASAASGSWTAGSGAAPASGTAASFITQYTTTGRKDIVYNTNTYTGFVNIAIDQSSFIPVIQSSAPVLHTDTFWVCKGSTANFNVQIASADTFQWNFGGATTPNTYYGSTYQNLTGLTFNTAGTFSITVRIKTSCCGWSPYDTVYLLVEPTSTISYTGPTSFCPGDSVHIILSGTASSYSWAPVAGVSNPAGSNVYISPAVTTTYLATAYSPRGLCNADTAITITKNLPPTLTFTSTPATCGSVGSATVTPSPAGSYTYVWSPGGGAGASISPEPAGTYSVTVTPQGTTCSVTGSTSISAAGGLQAYVLKTVSPKCFGQCTGLVKVEAIGGTAPFTYHWSNGPSTLDSIVNLCAGTYTVTITDANSCTATATQLLSQPQLLTVAILDSASPVCAGQCTGRAHGDGQGGTGPYTLVWSNGETGLYDTLLCVGHYTVALVDNNNCTASGAVNISSPPAMTVAFATVNDSCHGLCDGRLKATVTNGRSPYTYLWNNATTGPLDSNLCASTYTVTVTDSFSCTVTASSAISQPTALTASITGSINDSCFGLCDGRATVAAAGGTSGYTYVWANTTTGTIDSNLCQGNYTVTAKDALGCTATASIAITQPVVLSATITTTNVSCNGVCDGTATAVPAGGTAPYTYTWSNAATTVTAGSLCAGAYTVTVKDHNGCTAVANTAITQPTPLTISLVSSRNDSCNGQCNGQIVVLASGGTTAYTYTWSNAATGATANNLCTNSYTVTVKDAHLCSATLTQAITQPTVLTASITATTNVTCNGLCNGSTTAGATGGTAPYTYTWSNAATTPTISSLCAATYTVTVKDALGCTATATTTITQPVALTVAISTQVNVSCNAACDGSLTAAAVGGTGPYTYTWSDTHTGATDNNLCAATYTVTAQDANNCTATVSATITQPVVLTVAITSTRNDSCNGKCDGRVAVAAAGGTLPYTYTWADGTGGPVDSDLCAVPASVTVTDAHGCTATTGTTITQPTPLVLSLVSTTPPSCFGGSNGQIVVSATGGTPIYYYSVDFGPLQATGTFTGLSAGMHAVGVGDSHICIDTLHILLGQPALLVADTIATTEVSCNGGTNGTITVGVSGGTYPYHYVWPTSPSNTDSLGTGFAAGTYAVNVTDANGCTATTGATITQPTPLTGTAATDSVSCNGGSDGQVTITPAGGTPSYTYQLDGAGAFQPSDNFTGLAAGPHSVIIHDANSCSTTVNFTIYQPNVLTISITSTRDDSCNGLCDGRASALAAGGTQPYTYVWGDGTGGLVDSNLCAGAANVTVTDARNCTATISTNITQPTPLVLSLVSTTPPSCYGSTDATITVSASGGTAVYQYSFDGGTLQASGLFTGITGGTHVLGVTDAHLCTDTIHVNIVQPSQIVGDTISTHDITCYGGSDGAITLGVSGGTYPYTYTWPQSPTTADSLAVNLIAGTYSAYITDARGCHDTVTTVITQPAQLTATFTTDSVSCNGNSDGKVFIAATGGVAPYGYQLDAPGTYQAADSFTALAAGPHSVIVQDANGCTTTVNFTIYQPLPLTVALSNPTNVTCAGQCNGSVTSTPSGGTAPYTYLWCDGSSAPGNSNLCAGTCGVTVTDARGCTATISVTITQPQPLALTQTGATPPHCFDGNDATFAISATGGMGAYQFSADSGVTYQAGTTFTGRTPGSVPVQVKDANGCIDTLTVVIPNAPQNDTYTTSETDVSCNGGSDGTVTTTLASGTTTPYSYTWSYQNATTPNLANVPAGTYYVTITDANGCKVYGPDSTVVSQPQPITDVYTVTMPKCYGGSDGCVNVTPTGGTGPYTHSWSNGATTANPCVFAAGSYTDTITDAHGCVHIDNSIVVGQPQPVTETITATPVACPGDSSGTITVAGGGGTPGYTYSWAAPLSSSSATVSGLHTGTYTVTVTDANSCTTTASATVTAAIPLVLNAQKKNVLCPPLKNGAINLPLTGGTPPYSFVWDNGTTSPYQYGLAVGTYNVTITDANGCVTDTSFVVGNDSSFVLRVTPDTATINEGQTVQLAADVTGGVLASINWSPDYEISCTDCTTPQASPLATTQYLIHAVSDSGCVSDAQSIITVLIQHQIYVPNTFTPNNDGINDVWEIFGTKTAWKYVEVEIFDRWGEKVFESTDINFGWDGSFKGTMMEPNVYVYVLKVTFIDGYTASNKGTITIIR